MGRLPAGYQELTHIESTGTQYIDTGVYPTSGDEFSVTFKFDSVPTSTHTIFGVSNNVNANPVICLDTFTRPTFRFGTSSGWISRFQNITTEKTTASLSGSMLSIGNSSYNASQIGTTSNYSLKLFAFHGNSGIGGCGSFKLYGFKWIRASNTVRNMIPAKRLSDCAIGMYDLISQSFFGNSGTGAFIPGAPVIEPTWGSGLAQVTQKEMLARRFAITAKKLWLYRDGDECVDVTGGWDVSNAACKKLEDHIFLNYSGKTASGFCATALAVDITGYETLHAIIETVQQESSWSDRSLYVGLSTFANRFSPPGPYWYALSDRQFYPVSNTIYDISLNVSDIQGDFCVCACSYGVPSSAKVKEIWLE